MRRVRIAGLAVMIGLIFAEPALANGAVKVPEPDQLLLLSLGVLGLVVGRRAARKKPRD